MERPWLRWHVKYNLNLSWHEFIFCSFVVDLSCSSSYFDFLHKNESRKEHQRIIYIRLLLFPSFIVSSSFLSGIINPKTISLSDCNLFLFTFPRFTFHVYLWIDEKQLFHSSTFRYEKKNLDEKNKCANQSGFLL